MRPAVGHEEGGDGRRCIVVHDRHHMRIRLQRDCDVGVAEPFLHDTLMNAGLQRQRRPRVPQAVHRNRRQPVPDHSTSKCLVDTLGMKWFVIRRGEHQITSDATSTGS